MTFPHMSSPASTLVVVSGPATQCLVFHFFRLTRYSQTCRVQLQHHGTIYPCRLWLRYHPYDILELCAILNSHKFSITCPVRLSSNSFNHEMSYSTFLAKLGSVYESPTLYMPCLPYMSSPDSYFTAACYTIMTMSHVVCGSI